jgi:peptide/nickel transport system substrate-binding protein
MTTTLLGTDRLSRRTLLTLTAAGAGAHVLGGSVRPAMAQDDAPVRGGSFHSAAVASITSLDPFTSKSSSADVVCYRALYNCLLEVGNTGEFMPELATDWTISEDGLTYTFNLVEGVTFHDGTALDASAVKVNLERNMADGSTYGGAAKLRVISAIDVPDAKTLVLTLTTLTAPFLGTVGSVPIVSPKAIEEMGEDLTTHGVGSGPFTFVSWEPGAAATFTRNENYWEIAPDGQAYPYLDEYVVDGLPDDSVRLLNLRSGELQYIERINPRDLSSIANDPNVVTIETPHATPNLVALNPNIAPFDNKLLRQAISYALDRQAIVDNISFGTGYVTPMPFPKGAWFFIEEPSPVYDPEKAKQLLAEAGYPDGIEVPMTHINRTIDTQIAQIMKAQLEAVGIRMTIESLERTTWVDLWTAGEGKLGLLQGGMVPTDPDTQTGLFRADSTSNWANWQNTELQALIDESNSTNDQAERLAIWEKATALIVDEAVYIFIGAIPTVGGAGANVHDLQIAGGQAWNVVTSWLN